MKNYDRQLSYVSPCALLSSSPSTIRIRTSQLVISREPGFSVIAKDTVVTWTLYCDKIHEKLEFSLILSSPVTFSLDQQLKYFFFFFFLLINKLVGNL